MARRYDMKKRRAAAAQTRGRIVAAAHSLLNRRDGGRLGVAEVAAAAGVTRATVYNRIGTRRHLLEAVFRDQGRRIEFDRVLAAMAGDSPGSVPATIRESCRAWSIMPHAIRRTLALAATDREVAALVDRFERARHGRVVKWVRRLAAAGSLSEGVDPGYATSVLALATSFAAHDGLSAGLPTADVERHLILLAQSGLGLPA